MPSTITLAFSHTHNMTTQVIPVLCYWNMLRLAVYAHYYNCKLTYGTVMKGTHFSLLVGEY